jgi:hypothetical protein
MLFYLFIYFISIYFSFNSLLLIIHIYYSNFFSPLADEFEGYQLPLLAVHHLNTTNYYPIETYVFEVVYVICVLN